MSVRRETMSDNKTGKRYVFWMVDFVYQHPNGRKERIRKKSPIQTRRGADDYEQQLRQALLEGDFGKEIIKSPKFCDFQKEFVTMYAEINNKPSEVSSKRRILTNHLVPFFGNFTLDAITARHVEQYKTHKLKRDKMSPKSLNNHLAVLRRLLSVAADFKVVPSQQADAVKFVKAPKPVVDFLDFEEAQRLIEATSGQTRVMTIVALNTGMRLGELLALRWQDVDLVSGRIIVRRNFCDEGVEVTPKSGRSREIPLNEVVASALRGHRHLRSKLVFCREDGSRLTRMMAYGPLVRAGRRAGIITEDKATGWHTLRHTFASHLVMRGVPIKVVGDLLGHSAVAVTERYTHLTPDVRKDAVNELLGSWQRCGKENSGDEKSLVISIS